MPTGAEFANVTNKRLMSSDDFGTRFLDYIREEIRASTELAFSANIVFGTALGLAADGNDKFQVTGTSLATDGDGNIINIANGVKTGIQFQNTVAIPYYVALKHNLRPTGVQINPRTGLPEYVKWTHVIGEKAAPSLVTDNGNSTLTLTIDTVTEAGVSNAGRQALVYKNTLAAGGTLEATAIETCTVVFSGGFNRITTVGLLGQTAASTTAADYTVILLGPTVKRNTDLRLATDKVFLGIVTGVGAGSPPAAFSTADQRVSSASLSELGDVTRLAGNGRLKIEVKAISGESAEDQLRVKNAAGVTVWSVDEAGNMVVAGTTTQHNVVQVNSNETVTGSLIAGDAAADTHTIRGTWRHQDETGVTDFININGTTGLMRSQTIEPHTDNAFDLGSITRRWANAYIQNLNFSGDFIPQVDNSQSLGSVGVQWANVYARQIIGTASVATTHGVRGVGNTTGAGVHGTGGATNGSTGVYGTSSATNGVGVIGLGTGTGAGGSFTGGASGVGVSGASSSNYAGLFISSGGNTGLVGLATQASLPAGITALQINNYNGVLGVGGNNDNVTLNGLPIGNGAGVRGVGTPATSGAREYGAVGGSFQGSAGFSNTGKSGGHGVVAWGGASGGYGVGADHGRGGRGIHAQGGNSGEGSTGTEFDGAEGVYGIGGGAGGINGTARPGYGVYGVGGSGPTVLAGSSLGGHGVGGIGGSTGVNNTTGNSGPAGHGGYFTGGVPGTPTAAGDTIGEAGNGVTAIGGAITLTGYAAVSQSGHGGHFTGAAGFTGSGAHAGHGVVGVGGAAGGANYPGHGVLGLTEAVTLAGLGHSNLTANRIGVVGVGPAAAAGYGVYGLSRHASSPAVEGRSTTDAIGTYGRLAQGADGVSGAGYTGVRATGLASSTSPTRGLWATNTSGWSGTPSINGPNNENCCIVTTNMTPPGHHIYVDNNNANARGITIRANTSPVYAPFHIRGTNAVSGASQIGDMYVTVAGVLKICTVAGTPGTWVSVGAQT